MRVKIALIQVLRSHLSKGLARVTANSYSRLNGKNCTYPSQCNRTYHSRLEGKNCTYPGIAIDLTTPDLGSKFTFIWVNISLVLMAKIALIWDTAIALTTPDLGSKFTLIWVMQSPLNKGIAKFTANTLSSLEGKNCTYLGQNTSPVLKAKITPNRVNVIALTTPNLRVKIALIQVNAIALTTPDLGSKFTHIRVKIAFHAWG